MSKPLAQLDIFRTSAESQKVSLHVQGGVFLLEKVLRGVFIVRDNIRGEIRRDRGRLRSARGCSEGLWLVSCWRCLSTVVGFGWIGRVLVIAASTEALTPGHDDGWLAYRKENAGQKMVKSTKLGE
jgi:hypothetical protein